jgi:hypothetical protein
MKKKTYSCLWNLFCSRRRKVEARRRLHLRPDSLDENPVEKWLEGTDARNRKGLGNVSYAVEQENDRLTMTE